MDLRMSEGVGDVKAWSEDTQSESFESECNSNTKSSELYVHYH